MGMNGFQCQENSDFGYSVCVPECNSNNDCDAMGMNGYDCTDITGIGYGTCTVTSTCTVTGDDDECDDDQQCVDGRCFGLCDTDDDCEGSTPCEDFKDILADVWGLGNGAFDDPMEEVVLFSYCNILREITTKQPTMEPTVPTMVPSAQPTMEPTNPEEYDGAEQVSLIGVVIV